MKHFLLSAAIRIVRALLYGALGAFLVLLFLFVWDLQKRPDLNVWHKADLDAEFTIKSKVSNFQEYLDLEEKLFAQLDKLVYGHTRPEDRSIINRYNRGSLADPNSWSPDWNRTFELTTESPKAGVLLLHGLSDSPYSMRSLGRRLHAAGARVLGLRVPGHGTAPSGLVDVKWEDMAAAVRLAMRHLQDEVGSRPLYIVGSLGLALTLLCLSILDFSGNFKGIPVLVIIMVYLAFFSSCIGPVFWTYMSEIFPNRIRGTALSVPVFTQWIFNALVVLVFPLMLTKLQSSFTFLIIFIMAAGQLLFSWKYMKETKGKSLEEIEHLWE